MARGALADEADLAFLTQTLQQPLSSRPDVFRTLFLEMWAQIPNWKGSDPMWVRKPEPRWVPPPPVAGQPRAKRPPPHDPELLDWLAALQEMSLDAPQLLLPPPDPNPPVRGKKSLPPAVATTTTAEVVLARSEALQVVVVMRALAASKRAEVVPTLFAKAFADEGVFRDECGRQIRSLESVAVPPLVRLMYAKGPPKQRRYASYQLDRMDLAQPRKAISGAPDDKLRGLIVHAYGEALALNAVEPILDQVDANSHRVRREARAAWLGYVTGPPPPPAPRRKRKLPGGREEVEEKPDYLTYREIAELAIRKRLAEVTDEDPEAKETVQSMTTRLFALYDQRRAAEWTAPRAAADAAAAAGDWKTAVDGYRELLALNPEPDGQGRARMAHAYYQLGEQRRRDGAKSEALALLRQARELGLDGADAIAAQARIQAIEGRLSVAGEHRRRLRIGLILGALCATVLALAVAWFRLRRRPEPAAG